MWDGVFHRHPLIFLWLRVQDILPVRRIDLPDSSEEPPNWNEGRWSRKKRGWNQPRFSLEPETACDGAKSRGSIKAWAAKLKNMKPISLSFWACNIAIGIWLKAPKAQSIYDYLWLSLHLTSGVAVRPQKPRAVFPLLTHGPVPSSLRRISTGQAKRCSPANCSSLRVLASFLLTELRRPKPATALTGIAPGTHCGQVPTNGGWR